MGPGVTALALLLALPVLVVVGFLFVPSGEVWRHLAETVLEDYVANSLLLMAGVALGTLIGGVGTARLVSMYRFPGRGLLAWALLLPIAMPAYIITYTYTGLLHFAEPVQTTLSAVTGWGFADYWFPQVRSLPGAVVMLSLVLYPFVNLLARAAFLDQSLCVPRAGAGTPMGDRLRALPRAGGSIRGQLHRLGDITAGDHGGRAAGHDRAGSRSGG